MWLIQVRACLELDSLTIIVIPKIKQRLIFFSLCCCINFVDLFLALLESNIILQFVQGDNLFRSVIEQSGVIWLACNPLSDRLLRPNIFN